MNMDMKETVIRMAAKKIALCIAEDKKPAPLDKRFGRSAFFYILEAGSGEILEKTPNPHCNDSQGAGIATVQMLSEKGVQAFIAPHLGPKAADLCDKLGIVVYDQGETGTLEELWALWLEGRLSPAEKPTGGLRKV